MNFRAIQFAIILLLVFTLLGGVLAALVFRMEKSTLSTMYSIKVRNHTDSEIRFEPQTSDFDPVAKAVGPANWIPLSPKKDTVILGANANGQRVVALHVKMGEQIWKLPCGGGDRYFRAEVSATKDQSACQGSDSRIMQIFGTPEVIPELLDSLWKNFLTS